MIYYIADPHFGHANIIKYCDRPFKGVLEMDSVMIKNWNDRVTESDTVYVLGDFAWSLESFIYALSHLKGNMIFIPGNHDIKMQRTLRTDTRWRGFCTFTDQGILSINDVVEGEKKHVILCHYPMVSWNRKYHGSIHLYGHEHGKIKKYDTHAFDVGVECWDYRPVTLEEIIITEWKKGTLYEKDSPSGKPSFPLNKTS